MDNVALTVKERRQLLAVLREIDDSAPSEQRAHVRRKVLLDVWIRGIPSPADQGKSWSRKALILNVAARGVGLLLKEPLARGDKFAILLRFREGGGWLALCEVRNCRAIAASEERRTAKQRRFKVGAHLIDRIEDPKGNADLPPHWVE